jgi:hypothetical protein
MIPLSLISVGQDLSDDPATSEKGQDARELRDNSESDLLLSIPGHALSKHAQDA